MSRVLIDIAVLTKLLTLEQNDSEYQRSKETVERSIKNGKDEIQIVWGIEDVQTCIEERYEVNITDEQARKILKIADETHDACYGICWETFDAIYDCHII